MQTLLDVVADIPGILEDSDSLLEPAYSDKTRDSSMICARVLSCIHMLFLWRMKWEILFPHVAFRVAIDSTAHLAHLRFPENLATKSLWFTQFERAHEIAIYNCALLTLLRLLETWDDRQSVNLLLENLASSSETARSVQPLLLPSHPIDPDRIIEEVYCSVSYLLHPAHAQSGVIALYHPLRCWFVSREMVPILAPKLWADVISANCIANAMAPIQRLALRFGNVLKKHRCLQSTRAALAHKLMRLSDL